MKNSIFGKKITQSVGDNSPNATLVAGDMLIVNISTEEGEVILRKIWDEYDFNLLEAKETIEARVNDFIKSYLKILIEKKINLMEFKNPDFQYIVRVAQREHARSGNEGLKNLLIDLLVQRTKSEENLLTITLNEAIEVVAKLTKIQLEFLSFLYANRYSGLPSNDNRILYFIDNILDFKIGSALEYKDILHLEYLRLTYVKEDYKSEMHEFSSFIFEKLKGNDYVKMDPQYYKSTLDKCPKINEFKETWRTLSVYRLWLSGPGKLIALSHLKNKDFWNEEGVGDYHFSKK